MKVYSKLDRSFNKKKEKKKKKILTFHHKISFDNESNIVSDNIKEQNKLKNSLNISKEQSYCNTLNNSFNICSNNSISRNSFGSKNKEINKINNKKEYKNLIFHYIKKSLEDEEKKGNEILKKEKEKLNLLKNTFDINKKRSVEKKTFSGIKIVTYFNDNEIENCNIPFYQIGKTKLKDWLKKYNMLLSALVLFNLPDSYKLQIVNNDDNIDLKINSIKFDSYDNNNKNTNNNNNINDNSKDNINNKSFNNDNKLKAKILYNSPQKIKKNNHLISPDVKDYLRTYKTFREKDTKKTQKIIKTPYKLIFKKDENKKNNILTKTSNGFVNRIENERKPFIYRSFIEFRNDKDDKIKYINEKIKKEKEKNLQEKISKISENFETNHLQPIRELVKECSEKNIKKNVHNLEKKNENKIENKIDKKEEKIVETKENKKDIRKDEKKNDSKNIKNEVKKDEIKESKKDENKDIKKDFKKEEQKDIKKNIKKDDIKGTKKDMIKDIKIEAKKENKAEIKNEVTKRNDLKNIKKEEIKEIKKEDIKEVKKEEIKEVKKEDKKGVKKEIFVEKKIEIKNDEIKDIKNEEIKDNIKITINENKKDEKILIKNESNKKIIDIKKENFELNDINQGNKKEISNENNEEIIKIENGSNFKSIIINNINKTNCLLSFYKFIPENKSNKYNKILSNLYIKNNSKEFYTDIFINEEIQKPNKKIKKQKTNKLNKIENKIFENSINDTNTGNNIEILKPVIKKRKPKPTFKKFDENLTLSLKMEQEKEESEKKLIDKARNLRHMLKNKNSNKK